MAAPSVMSDASRHVFGPVPSRRYGRSLGVDLSTPKTCTLDCRFCQLGATPRTTVQRTDTPPIANILAELRAWVAAGNAADFVTASGSGEPTLHLHFGDLFGPDLFLQEHPAALHLAQLGLGVL